MTLPCRQRRELKRLSENEPSIEITGKSRLVSLKDTRDAAARLSTADTPRSPDTYTIFQYSLLPLQWAVNIYLVKYLSRLPLPVSNKRSVKHTYNLMDHLARSITFSKGRCQIPSTSKGSDTSYYGQAKGTRWWT